MINSQKSINAIEYFIASQDVKQVKTTMIEFYSEWVNSESNYDKNICRTVTDQFISTMKLIDACMDLQEERKHEVANLQN